MSDTPDPVVSILEHLFAGQEGNTRLLADIGRDVARLVQSMTDLQSSVDRLTASVDLLTGQVRSTLENRLTPLEKRVSELEHAGAPPNGSG